MATIAQQITEMIDILPEAEQGLAFEVVKRLVLAWDPDYTKVTESEAAELEAAEMEIARGDFVSEEDI